MKYDIENYDEARNLAYAIKQNAENVESIFNKMTDVMNKLASDWQGSGADAVQQMYVDIKSNYPVFKERIIADTDHILAVVGRDEDAEAASRAAFENAG